jgi:serine carboxypeptidase-like clade II
MKSLIATFVAIALVANSVRCADPTKDKVTFLINVTEVYNQTWYSGYVNVTTGQSIHYWFFPSQNKPASDPVILWLNGGPGCSSLLGATTENGPFMFDEGGINFVRNPYSWNTNASVIYFESPPGVGYSPSNTEKWNVNSTAQANLEGLKDFFKAYSNFKDLDFYISGESYAGVYIPSLANAILEHNAKVLDKIKLKGFAIGNGCTLTTECNGGFDPFFYQFIFEHAIIPSWWEQPINNSCSKSMIYPDCILYRNKAAKSMDGIDIYNVIGPCYYPPSTFAKQYTSWRQDFINEKTEEEIAKLKHESMAAGLKGAPPCTNDFGPNIFFNNATVRAQLHIPVTVPTWTMCNDNINSNYGRMNASYYLYPSLVAAGLRIWIYSGDTDAAVPITGTTTWLQMLKEQLKKTETTPWRAWFYNSTVTQSIQNGGQFWQYQGMTFVSFKGAGHMVPTDNP